MELSSPAGMHSWLNPNARANHLSVAVVAPLATHALRVLVRSQHVVERSSRSTISTRITSTIILQGLGKTETTRQPPGSTLNVCRCH